MSATGRGADYYTPRVVIKTKVAKEADSPKKIELKSNKNKVSETKTKSPVKVRPATVQATVRPEAQRNIDYRSIKSPNLRRKVYSANITPKTNRPFTPNKDFVKQVNKDLEQNKRLSAKRETNFSSNGIKKPTSNNKTKDESLPRATPYINKKRPLTTGYKNPALENLTIKHNLQSPYEPNKPKTANQVIRAAKDLVQKSEWEKNFLAFGDTNTRAVTAPHSNHGRKPTIYDPIAKSIADYVANNVPDRLPKFPWIKK